MSVKHERENGKISFSFNAILKMFAERGLKRRKMRFSMEIERIILLNIEIEDFFNEILMIFI